MHKKNRVLLKSKKFFAEVIFLLWPFELKNKQIGDMGTLNTVYLLFDRTYDILLNRGTPFDTGVDLDPSISLRGKQNLSCQFFK